jgi:hypothetical protein
MEGRCVFDSLALRQCKILNLIVCRTPPSCSAVSEAYFAYQGSTSIKSFVDHVRRCLRPHAIGRLPCETDILSRVMLAIICSLARRLCTCEPRTSIFSSRPSGMWRHNDAYIRSGKRIRAALGWFARVPTRCFFTDGRIPSRGLHAL